MLNYVYKMRSDRACHTPSIEVMNREVYRKILECWHIIADTLFGPSDQRGVFQ
jgi:hypothetical protein